MVLFRYAKNWTGSGIVANSKRSCCLCFVVVVAVVVVVVIVVVVVDVVVRCCCCWCMNSARGSSFLFERIVSL